MWVGGRTDRDVAFRVLGPRLLVLQRKSGSGLCTLNHNPCAHPVAWVDVRVGGCG